MRTNKVSTRFASFCTVLISEIVQICITSLLTFAEISQKFAIFLQNPRKSGNFREKNCETSTKFDIAAVQKDANLVDLEKCCQTYFLAKFRFDTAENEPAKNLQKFANFPNFANF